MKPAYYYSLVFIICALLIATIGCTNVHNQVVNTNSGVIFHSSEFTNKSHNPDSQYSSNVIHLGEDYEKIELDIKPETTIKM